MSDVSVVEVVLGVLLEKPLRVEALGVQPASRRGELGTTLRGANGRGGGLDLHLVEECMVRTLPCGTGDADEEFAICKVRDVANLEEVTASLVVVSAGEVADIPPLDAGDEVVERPASPVRGSEERPHPDTRRAEPVEGDGAETTVLVLKDENVPLQVSTGAPVVSLLLTVGAGAYLTLAGGAGAVTIVVLDAPAIGVFCPRLGNFRLQFRAAALVVSAGVTVRAGDGSIPSH